MSGRQHQNSTKIVRSAGAAVFRENPLDGQLELLMVRAHGKWNFPKGHVELGESLEETAHREVKEETEQEFDIISTTPIVYDVLSKYKSDSERKEVVLFLGEHTSPGLVLDGGRVRNNDENDMAWFMPVSDIEVGKLTLTKSAAAIMPTVLAAYRKVKGL